MQGLLRDQLSLQRDQLLQEAGGVDASIFENPRFIEMQEKMQSHFSSKQAEAESRAAKLLSDMETAIKEAKVSREAATKEISALNQAVKDMRNNVKKKPALVTEDVTQVI